MGISIHRKTHRSSKVRSVSWRPPYFPWCSAKCLAMAAKAALMRSSPSCSRRVLAIRSSPGSETGRTCRSQPSNCSRCWAAIPSSNWPRGSTFRSISFSQLLAQQLPLAADHASPDGKLPHTAARPVSRPGPALASGGNPGRPIALIALKFSEINLWLTSQRSGQARRDRAMKQLRLDCRNETCRRKIQFAQ